MAISRSRTDREQDKFRETFDGQTVVATQETTGLLNGVEFDAVTVTYPNSSTESYALRQGGTTGTIVNTITIIYTDSSKSNILSVERT